MTFSKEEVTQLIKDKKVKYKIKHIGNKKNKEYKSKYVLDVEVITTVTEYRYYQNQKGKYNIQKNMEPEVQYGSMMKALMSYFTTEMMAPLNKTKSFFRQITNNVLKVSEGTIVTAQKRLDEKLSPIVAEIKERLIKAKVLHVDETGIRINGGLNWLHTCCSKDYVYYEVNAKRGSEAIDAIGILAYFVNILVHDHWKAYYKETHMTHAECNAHILRCLKGAKTFAKIRSFISTCKLRTDNLITEMVKIFEEPEYKLA